MAPRIPWRSVIIEGTIIPSTWDLSWDAEGIVIVTPERALYEEYLVERDEIGRKLAEHLHEFVRVYGVLRRVSHRRKVVRVTSFDVIRVHDDDEYFPDHDDELDRDEEDLLYNPASR